MYLRALEIQGFKSFPDKTVLNFGEDITAIVGPNGSGKSNISDAIRWVMGEQSVKGLRGAKMEDVIFGGTEKRSQVGFAQVTLVLDNTEHIFPTMEESEVSVTRRYYRSGESEYYINRQSVRLKDLTELFLDTGMGREGYSIIGQGKIDEILSAKSGERREIFEEAAGISKFRHRKEEAERKLERTEENLVRINDKIAELELQVEPLREQAEKARKYLVLRDELRLLEISVWLENLDTLKAGARKLEADFHAAESQRDEARAALDALYAEGERYSERMREKDMEAERVRTESAVLEEQIKEKESAAAVLESTVTHNRENIQRAEAELAEAESRSGGLAKQAEEQEARVAEIDRRIGELKRDITALGTPNIGAIDEFQRVNTRYTYLTDQRNDVEKAKGELQNIIGEITEEMTKIFAEQFKLLSESFQTTFQELFGGGTARLELEDEEDILGCGIEIKAQPPGKTLKTISLLSGGEKAFVAIALYFSILKVHPTPFCVMDEIEAALDDANVTRYARYMRTLAGRTQFIVITHRRGTMEEADVLYGVTMQEQGVSKILRLSLDELAKQLGVTN